MKKMMLLAVLFTGFATVLNAQESRQDISVSAVGLFGPGVHGNAIEAHTLGAAGFLGEYRYMLTPRSGLEANYSYIQNSMKFLTPAAPKGYDYVHVRDEEASFAYVYTRNYHNFNPFVQLGVGAMIFTPIRDYATTTLDTKQNTAIGMVTGGGVAYEISPSFDVRVEYRGFLCKTPTFGNDNYKTNRYEWLSMPAVGIAYHF
jgi:outer membrane immunogenic protein